MKLLPWARCEVLADCLNDELLRTSSGGRGVEPSHQSLDLLRVIGRFYSVTIFKTIVAKTNYKVFLTDKRQRRRGPFSIDSPSYCFMFLWTVTVHHSTAREWSDDDEMMLMMMARVRGDAAASPFALCLALK